MREEENVDMKGPAQVERLQKVLLSQPHDGANVGVCVWGCAACPHLPVSPALPFSHVLSVKCWGFNLSTIFQKCKDHTTNFSNGPDTKCTVLGKWCG